MYLKNYDIERKNREDAEKRKLETNDVPFLTKIILSLFEVSTKFFLEALLFSLHVEKEYDDERGLTKKEQLNFKKTDLSS